MEVFRQRRPFVRRALLSRGPAACLNKALETPCSRGDTYVNREAAPEETKN
jgi:hypothetical protein